MIFQLFAANVPAAERSRAFGYLISAGTVGQTFAALFTSHIYWPWMFYKFGALGIIWTYLWYKFYYRSLEQETRSSKVKLVDITDVSCDIEAPMIVTTTSGGNSTSSSISSSSSSGKFLHFTNNRRFSHWIQFVSYWQLWAIYIAHFAMNWSNYIIMQWLPYYMSRYLGADPKSLSLTAMPYIMNSIAGIGNDQMTIFL